MSFLIQSRSAKPILYLFIGLVFYIIAVILGVIFKGIFPEVTSKTVDGRELDIASYLILATFDLILFIVQLVLTVVMLLFVWVWNDLIVGFFIHGLGNILNWEVFKSIGKYPISNITIVSQSFETLRYLLVGFVGDFFGDIDEAISDIFGGIL